MRRLGTICAGLMLLFVQAVVTAADKPFVHPLFASDMVLQRGMEDPIWGWTEPGKTVTVSMSGKSVTATADKDGKWMAKIGPFEAGGPFDLNISGPQEVKLTNVLVGDVWICSGQSNMEMGLGNAYDKDHEITSANHSQIRLFTVPKHVAYTPQTDFGTSPHPNEAQWLECNPKNIMVGDWAGFSAVGYFFGRDLHEKLHVPIGLIHTSWGGTICEAWVSGPSLKKMVDFQETVDTIEKTGKAPASPNGRRDTGPNVPTVLYNGMIAPLEPMAIKGAIWYQGESNAGRAKQYRTLLPTMIGDWRSRFTGGGDFPFFIVQLASFMRPSVQPEESQWAELREAQAYAAETVGHSAIAVTLDLGNALDIHPKNKQEVGARLALDALAIAYGQDVEYSGPVYKQMTVEGNKARLKFDHTAGGLAAAGGPLGDFAIAGDDGKFVWADARIDHDTVVVSSKQVEKPKAVRYGWTNNADLANLVNKAGLPAAPFRTDAPSTPQ